MSAPVDRGIATSAVADYRVVDTTLVQSPLEDDEAGGGITYPSGFQPVLGTPLDRDWPAAIFHLYDLVTGEEIDGYVAIADRYVTAGLNPLGQDNTGTFLIRADATDANRTIVIPPWIEEPYYHALTLTHQPCSVTAEEAALPVEYGAPAALHFDGSSCQTHDISELFNVDVRTPLAEFSIYFPFKIANLGGAASEVLVSLYRDGVTNDRLAFLRVNTTNVLEAALVVNGSPATGGVVAPGHDMDVGAQGGEDTWGWACMEGVTGAGGNLNLTCRVSLNGNNVSATQTVLAANIAGLDGAWDRLKVGALPDDSNKATNGTEIGPITLVKKAGGTTVWDAVRQNTADPHTQFIPALRAECFPWRTPWGTLDRSTGKEKVATVGTPTIVTAGVPAHPCDVSLWSMGMQFTVSPLDQSLYIPESAGLYKLFWPPGQDAETIDYSFTETAGADLANTHEVEGPVALLPGRGRVLNFVASGAFKVCLVPLIEAAGP